MDPILQCPILQYPVPQIFGQALLRKGLQKSREIQHLQQNTVISHMIQHTRLSTFVTSIHTKKECFAIVQTEATQKKMFGTVSRKLVDLNFY